MNKLKNVFKKQKRYLIIGLLVVTAIIIFLFTRAKNNGEIYTVSKTDVMQSVVLSGKVQTSDRADLGFASAGRVNKIYVKNNQNVLRGQILAQLEIGDLLADLKIKEANSRTSDVDLSGAKEELNKVTIEQNTKVENAYRTLLSEDLRLVPDSIKYNLTAPTISGIYNGQEGQYKIFLDKERADLDLRILTLNLETTKQVINYAGQTPFGTKGLYISFPIKDPTPYENTVWTLDIPNKGGPSYLMNYNIYQQAKDTRDLEIKKAETKYQKLLSESDGGSSIALAEIQKINAEIRKNTIFAPFTGVVTNIEKKEGENASVGERVITILSESKLEVVLKVSELDVSRLIPTTLVSLKLDALPGEEFKGILKTINSRDTQIDGVPVYEAFVDVNPDSRIKTGMNATGTINITSKTNVLAIPNYFVKKMNDKNIVKIKSETGKISDREVTLGLLGTDSMVEVIFGLSEGDKIVSQN